MLFVENNFHNLMLAAIVIPHKMPFHERNFCDRVKILQNLQVLNELCTVYGFNITCTLNSATLLARNSLTLYIPVEGGLYSRYPVTSINRNKSRAMSGERDNDPVFLFFLPGVDSVLIE